jgi:hypothetical protein
VTNLDAHYDFVASRLKRGHVVPLLGAGANLCDRSGPWQEGSDLPSGYELSGLLAKEFKVPRTEAADLARASEWVDLMWGDGPLYERLHQLFDADYQANSLHTFLAGLPRRLAAADGTQRPLVMVTTNYDDVLERAFDAAGAPYDVLVYMAVGESQGRMIHYRGPGGAEVIERPEEYEGISLDRRSVILKLHGNVDRHRGDDSFVITEDDYLEYLTHSTNLSRLVPAPVLARLLRSHFLFLGYGLRDWNLRVLLHRLWGQRHNDYRSWAVQLKPRALDKKLWERQSVDVWSVPLAEYVAGVSARLPPASDVDPPIARAS